MESGVFYLHAAVHHDGQSRSFRVTGHVLMPGPQLKPQRFGSCRFGIDQDPGEVIVLPEDIHNVHRLRDLSQRRVGTPAQDFLNYRIHKVDAVIGRPCNWWTL